MSTHDRMCELVVSFPCIARAKCRDATGHWDPVVFISWAKTHAYSHGEKLAARFVLGVWNTDGWRALGKRFDFFEAMTTENRAAFVRWAERPWWP